MWLSFALPLRWLWLAWAAGLLYLWIGHREAVAGLLTYVAHLPIAGLLVVGQAALLAVCGLASGQILRRVGLQPLIKCAGTLIASVILIQVSSMLGEQQASGRQAEIDAFHAQQPLRKGFYERTEAAGRELVAKDARVALITGEAPVVRSGSPERRYNRAGLPAAGYFYQAVGARGEACGSCRFSNVSHVDPDCAELIIDARSTPSAD